MDGRSARVREEDQQTDIQRSKQAGRQSERQKTDIQTDRRQTARRELDRVWVLFS